MTWEAFWPAVLTGTVVAAVVTGLFTLFKPVVDYWVSTWTWRRDTAVERRKVVEGVVTQLRKLRIAHQREPRSGVDDFYELVLEASDSALLIDDQDFAKYLSLDIENTTGFRTLADYEFEHGNLDDDPAASARAARWDHLKTLVERASRFAVTGTWDKEWQAQAERLKKDMDVAFAAAWN